MRPQEYKDITRHMDSLIYTYDENELKKFKNELFTFCEQLGLIVNRTDEAVLVKFPELNRLFSNEIIFYFNFKYKNLIHYRECPPKVENKCYYVVPPCGEEFCYSFDEDFKKYKQIALDWCSYIKEMNIQFKVDELKSDFDDLENDVE